MSGLAYHIAGTTRPWYNCFNICSWWRHGMETFSALMAFCAGHSPVTGEFPSQRPVTRSFDAFFDLCRTIRLSKQLGGLWFEAASHSFWRHCNITCVHHQASTFNKKIPDNNSLYAQLQLCEFYHKYRFSFLDESHLLNIWCHWINHWWTGCVC